VKKINRHVAPKPLKFILLFPTANFSL